MHGECVGRAVKHDPRTEHGQNQHLGERGMSSVLRIEGGNANQPMDASFSFAPAIGLWPVDSNYGGPQASHAAWSLRYGRNCPPSRGCPQCVHTEQHGCPVTGIIATSPGLDFQETVATIPGAGEQHASSHAVQGRQQVPDRGLGLGSDLLVTLLNCKGWNDRARSLASDSGP